MASRLGESIVHLGVGGLVAGVRRRDEHVVGSELDARVHAELEVTDRVLALALGADHEVIGIAVVLGAPTGDGHTVLVAEAQDLVDLAIKQVGGVGVRTAAPQLDVVVAEALGILEDVLQRVALVARGEHTDLEHVVPSFRPTYLIQVALSRRQRAACAARLVPM